MVLYELESIGCPLLTLCRTLTCSFSEYKIYPGHGGMYIRKDGQVIIRSLAFLCSLCVI